LVFHSNGTGLCIEYNLNGSGFSNPLKDYQRIGKLTAICDQLEPSFCEIVIVSCAEPSISTYYEKICLGCGCAAE